MVTRLDRLARSTRDLLNTLATITGEGAGFRSCHGRTRRQHGRLMLAVLGGLAEFERELIRARAGEGPPDTYSQASAVLPGSRVQHCVT